MESLLRTRPIGKQTWLVAGWGIRPPLRALAHSSIGSPTSSHLVGSPAPARRGLTGEATRWPEGNGAP